MGCSHAACVKMLGCAGHVRIGSVTNIMRRIWTQRMSAPLTDGGEETGHVTEDPGAMRWRWRKQLLGMCSE